MRGKLGKAVRDSLEKELRRHLPGFRPVRDAEVPSGWRVFGLEAASDMMTYIVLAMHSQKDHFTIEGAWTRNGRFPGRVSLLWPRSFPDANIRRDQPRDGDFRFRLATLWQPRDEWWELVPRKSRDEQEREDKEFLASGAIPPEPSPEDALGKVDAMVNDAVQKIERHLLPYFDEVVAEAGQRERVSELASRR